MRGEQCQPSPSLSTRIATGNILIRVHHDQGPVMMSDSDPKSLEDQGSLREPKHGFRACRAALVPISSETIPSADTRPAAAREIAGGSVWRIRSGGHAANSKTDRRRSSPKSSSPGQAGIDRQRSTLQC